MLETQFIQTVKTEPELLARHYTQAGQVQQALPYWLQAGRLALERCANQEAIRHLRRGLALLDALPDNNDRARRELELQITIGPALMAVKGAGAGAVKQTYARADELCSQLGDGTHRFTALFGLWRFHFIRARFRQARELAGQCLGLARHNDDSAARLGAHVALGGTRFGLGELCEARTQFEQGMALYDSSRHHGLTFQYGFDPGVICLVFDAQPLWLLGYPQQALVKSRAAVALARQLSHSYSLVWALYYAARLHQFRGEADAVLGFADEVIGIRREQGFELFEALATMQRGWALANLQQPQQGLTQVRQGWTAYRAAGGELAGSYFLARHAEIYLARGELEQGLQAVDDAFALLKDSDERWWEAELHRLRGELLLAQSPAYRAAAENCLQQAVERARIQQARSLELRAATSLAGWWQHQARNQQARDLLAPVYDGFSEGFDTVDLQKARALLTTIGEF